MSVAGKWKLIVKGPTGPMSSILELTEADGVLSGTQSGQGSSSDLSEGKLEGSNIYWVNHTTKPMKMKLEFKGTVDGNAMTGKVKVGMIGSYPFTASLEP